MHVLSKEVLGSPPPVCRKAVRGKAPTDRPGEGGVSNSMEKLGSALAKTATQRNGCDRLPIDIEAAT